MELGAEVLKPPSIVPQVMEATEAWGHLRSAGAAPARDKAAPSQLVRGSGKAGPSQRAVPLEQSAQGAVEGTAPDHAPEGCKGDMYDVVSSMQPVGGVAVMLGQGAPGWCSAGVGHPAGAVAAVARAAKPQGVAAQAAAGVDSTGPRHSAEGRQSYPRRLADAAAGLLQRPGGAGDAATGSQSVAATGALAWMTRKNCDARTCRRLRRMYDDEAGWGGSEPLAVGHASREAPPLLASSAALSSPLSHWPRGRCKADLNAPFGGNDDEDELSSWGSCVGDHSDVAFFLP